MADDDLVDASTDQEGARTRVADRLALERSRTNPPPAPYAPASPPTQAAPGSHPDAAGQEGSHPSQGDAVPDVAAHKPRLVSLSDEEATSSEVTTRPDNAEAAAQAWLQRFGGDATRAHAEALRNDSRMAEMAKELEQTKRQLAAQGDQTAGTTAPEGRASEDDIKRAVHEMAIGDQECQLLAGEWQARKDDLEKILQFDPRGIPVSGVLLDLDRQIQTLKGQIDPASVGLNTQAPDEITRAELQELLDKAESHRERKLNEKMRLETEMAALDARYDRRTVQFRDHVHRQLTQRADEQQRVEVVATAERDFNRAWAEGFKEVAQGYNRDDAAFLERQLQLAANAVFTSPDGDIEPHQLLPWMKKVEGETRAFRDRARGRQAAQTARLKEQDTRQPAPPPETAIGQASAPSASARDRRRAADLRVSQRARHIVAR
jgi:hypothetical protein